MRKILISLMLLLLVGGCSQVVGALASSALGGGGPSLDAQAQIGKTNTSQRSLVSGVTQNAQGSIDNSRPKVRSENVGDVTVNELSISMLTAVIVLALVAGLFLALPTPSWLKFRKE